MTLISSRRAVLAGAASMVTVACSPQSVAQERTGTVRLSIATGGTGGVYYPYGGGLAKVISENVKGAQATAEVTSASVDNMKLETAITGSPVPYHKGAIRFYREKRVWKG